jgi:hypothetical protein
MRTNQMEDLGKAGKGTLEWMFEAVLATYGTAEYIMLEEPTLWTFLSSDMSTNQ